jgi:hypothetical protein
LENFNDLTTTCSVGISGNSILGADSYGYCDTNGEQRARTVALSLDPIRSTHVSSPSSGFDSSHTYPYPFPTTLSTIFTTPLSPRPTFQTPSYPHLSPPLGNAKAYNPVCTRTNEPHSLTVLPPAPATIGSRSPDITDCMAPESFGAADELAAGESSSSED